MIAEEALEALAAGAALVSAAVLIGGSTPVRLWGGHGSLTIESEVYTGIGDRGLVSVTGGALGGAEQGAQLELSRLTAEVLAELNPADYRRAPVVLRRLIFDATGSNLLDASVYLRGRIDELPIEEQPDGTYTLKAMVEGAARGLGRSGGRMRSDADQRLIDPNDGSFSRITYAGEVTLYWGGARPTTARGGLPGSGSGGAGGGRSGWTARDTVLV